MEHIALEIYWTIIGSYHLFYLTVSIENRFRFLSTRKIGYLHRYLNGELYK
jgi:hypothetical protein